MHPIKIAIAYTTKDKIDLTKQTIAPLVHTKISSFSYTHLWWFDGSDTKAGQRLPSKYPVYKVISNVRGGPDAAIVCALSHLLDSPNAYTHIGLVESDVLLPRDWLTPTMALFKRGEDEGLRVGAVSARCYEDRILCQRDGYAVMHNLGAGMVIFTREAAQLVLETFGTGRTFVNRQVFSLISGDDIGRWWAFRAGDHPLCADWSFDWQLARQGWASLALVPSCVEMVGQNPPLAEQWLHIAREPVEMFRDDMRFKHYRDSIATLASGDLELSSEITCIFPHHLPSYGGQYHGEWRMRWCQGHGPFLWVSSQEGDLVEFSASGPCTFLVQGPGKIQVRDHHSNYAINTEIGPSLVQAVIPGGYSFRKITLEALTPGIAFGGILCDLRLRHSKVKFSHSVLPPPEINK